MPMTPDLLTRRAELESRLQRLADGEPADPRAWLVAEANDFRLSAALCGLGDHPEWVDAALQDVDLPVLPEIREIAQIIGGTTSSSAARMILRQLIQAGEPTPGLVRLSLWLCAGYLSIDPERPPRGEGYPARDLALLAANLWALVAEGASDGLGGSP